MTTTLRSPAGHIRADQPDEQFTVHWGDENGNEVFDSRTVMGMIRHAQVIYRGEQRLSEAMQELANRTDAWVVKYRDRLRGAWLTMRDGGLLLVAMMRGPDYDEALHDALIDLSSEIACDKTLDVLDFTTLMLPPTSPEGLSSFLSPAFRIPHPAFAHS